MAVTFNPMEASMYYFLAFMVGTIFGTVLMSCIAVNNTKRKPQ